MPNPPLLPAVLLAALLGLGAGWAARHWLGRLRRGVVLQPGRLEVASAVISAVGTDLAVGRGPWFLVLWIGLLGVTLSAVDVAHHRLPDAITLPSIGVTLAVASLTELLSPETGELLRAVVGGLVLGLAFYALAFAVPSAMGRGDAKLAFSVGVALGYLSWPAVLLGVLLAFVIGSLTGVAGMIAGRLKLRSSIPFGPSMLLGCWLVLAIPPLAGALGRS